jgi:hypothetical protein
MPRTLVTTPRLIDGPLVVKNADPTVLQVGTLFGRDGMWLGDIGELTTDRYGLSTATAVWVSPQDRMQYPALDTQHPLWDVLYMEKQHVMVKNGYCYATCDYAGLYGEPDFIEEWSSGVSEEPIQTHPHFDSLVAQYGTVWIDPNTNRPSKFAAGHAIPAGLIFDKFFAFPKDDMTGVQGYLMPVVVRRITQVAGTPFFTSQVGTLVGGLLCTSVTATRRGRVYQNVAEYRGAGPNRTWNGNLYS